MNSICSFLAVDLTRVFLLVYIFNLQLQFSIKIYRELWAVVRRAECGNVPLPWGGFAGVLLEKSSHSSLLFKFISIFLSYSASSSKLSLDKIEKKE